MFVLDEKRSRFPRYQLGAGPLESVTSPPEPDVLDDAVIVKGAPAPAPRGNNVASPKESRLAQRIFNLHQKRKVARARGLESVEERRRFQEYAKFLMAYVTHYSPPNGLLRADVRENLLQVVRETPGMMPGLGFVQFVIFGVKVVAGLAGALFGFELLKRVEESISLDEKREETRQELIRQGRSADEIRKIMGAGGDENGGGVFAGLGDFAQYAFWGALLYLGWRVVEPMMKKRRRASA
ncbi:MAG: hypothetical protein L0Z48_10690 [candidate division Zixibacteria bacterium]|nr:hypothetical protein [candidate division Zixibacteria bacterium]